VKIKNLMPALLAGSLLMVPELHAADTSTVSNWKPKSSETLVKLPATYLKKSIDSDFLDSQLGKAISAADEDAGLKVKTLQDLKVAVEETEGDVQTELRHQFLAEKRAYLDLMTHKNKLKRKQVETKHRLFEDMLEKLGARRADLTPVKRRLVERQKAARDRFEGALQDVDMRLFETSAVPESKYAQKYAENMAVIEQLSQRIKSHQMSRAAQMDGRAITKEEYVRQLLSDAQAELSLLEQEDNIIGYMAKLVALDALALSEQTLDAELADSDVPATTGPARAVKFFLSN